jgi:hypothetical protein
MSRAALWLRRPLDDTRAALEALAAAPHPTGALAWLGVGLGVTWFVYVPLHELLHVAGCVLSGGTVSELQLDPIYGAGLLARWLPFVVPGGEHAGRLSGFDTGGSDAVYLATDFAPYLLSIGIGVPLLRGCSRGPHPFLLGAAAVLGLAPFYNVAGDYYEMGSILVTRAAALGRSPSPYAALRSDDLFALLGQLVAEPAALGLAGAGEIGTALLLILLGTCVGLLLAFLSYAAGRRLAAALLPA